MANLNTLLARLAEIEKDEYYVAENAVLCEGRLLATLMITNGHICIEYYKAENESGIEITDPHSYSMDHNFNLPVF
jgi:hypothetical protein